MSTVRLSGAKMTGVGLSFLLAFAGLLLLRRGHTPAGLALTVVGIAAFVAIAAVLQKSPIPEGDFAILKPLIGPGLAVLAGLAASILAIYFMETGAAGKTRDYGVAALWLSSVSGLIGGVLWAEKWRPVRANFVAWWRANRREILLVSGILAAALGARTLLLGQHPYPWSGDEASVGTEGRMILAGAKTNLFATGWAGQPNFSFLPTALTLSLFGENLIGIRMTSALAGTLAVLFTYLFARRAFDRRVALCAAAFLAAFPLHLQFSRIGVDNVNDSLMIVLVLWLVLLALGSDRVSVYTLAGVVTGLTFFTYV
ncbi:MAG: glycosyltransferase family 39 protein, partial [Chloroflexota bacterium]